MRTILFRGKDKITLKWVYGYYAVRQWGLDTRHLIYSGADIYDVVAETVGQFTGYKDMYGLNVYEGDNIKYFTGFEMENDNFSSNSQEVVWVDGYGGFFPFVLSNRWRCDVQGIEIVGNIHDK